ncbi:MAG TPA: protein kinase [Vicinamibacterales bacterium]|nr:protein kinase [Vicinamibacterales bacterium]
MSSDRETTIGRIYYEALALPAEDRAAFVADACDGDPLLLEALQARLNQSPPSDFLERPAFDVLGHSAGAVSAPRAAGQQFGPYRLQELLGRGGMGEVYRARDTRLSRDVALKFLPEAFSAAPDRLARFEREARLLASLNHPHIAAIYGVEDSSAGHALVMELVEGPTLADRLARGPVPVSEALSIAKQIAEAIESAHDQGIVHRDLKPANIKVRLDGTVKVLDFGLAKAIEPPGPPAPPASEASTTIGAGITESGVILGTAAYMSPEQARGQRVNAQTDIWAFGCVVYEMLTGRVAFGGATLTDTLAAVIDREPDWTALPRSTPGAVVRLLHRALEKNPARRLHAIADARLDLEEAPEATTVPAVGVTTAPRPRRALMIGAATIGLILVLGAAAMLLMRGESSAASRTPTRLSIAAPGQVTPQTSVAVSPDGRRLAFVSTDTSGRSMLWVRDLDALTPHVLTGTEDAAHPFWAPDGSAIGFLAGGKLKRVDATGGRVLTLADVTTRNGAAWSRTGVILFTPQAGVLATVPDTGGPVSTVRAGQDAGVWPSFLPDGRHFLFFRYGPDAVRGVYVGSLDDHTSKRVLATDYQASFAAPDSLLFVRGDGLLFAQHFDLTRLALTGAPTAVAEGVWTFREAARVSASAGGSVIAYINATLANTELAWFDRTGRPIGIVGDPGPYQNQGPRIAPDATRVAVARGAAGGQIWVTRLADNTAMRLTLQPGAAEPIWSDDASRILFQWARGPAESVVSVQDASGNGPATDVGAIGTGHVWDWSPDGRRIVFGKLVPGQAVGLWVLPVGANGAAVPFADSRFNETQAQIAPDGRWIAYTSYESGRDEVYVDSFPTAGNRRQISVGGGMQPRWRRDGSELFYLSPDQILMAVPVTTTPGRFDAGRARPLFRTQIVPQGSPVDLVRHDVRRDARRAAHPGQWAARRSRAADDRGPQLVGGLEVTRRLVAPCAGSGGGKRGWPLT